MSKSSKKKSVRFMQAEDEAPISKGDMRGNGSETERPNKSRHLLDPGLSKRKELFLGQSRRERRDAGYGCHGEAIPLSHLRTWAEEPDENWSGERDAAVSERQNARLHLFRGDVFRLEVDAVVLPAGPRLLGALDETESLGLLRQALAQAGDGLGAELRQLRMADHLPPDDPEGAAVAVGGYRLPAYYLIFINSDSAETLGQAYVAALKMAQYLRLTSIAFPCLPRGSFSNSEISCLDVLRSTRRWLDEVDSAKEELLQIVFVTRASEDERLYRRHIRRFFPKSAALHRTGEDLKRILEQQGSDASHIFVRNPTLDFRAQLDLLGSLDLSGVSELRDTWFWRLSESGSQLPLKTLVIRANNRLKGSFLSVLPNLTPQLTSLDLMGCTKLRETFLPQLLRGCEQLMRVDLTACDIRQRCALPRQEVELHIENTPAAHLTKGDGDRHVVVLVLRGSESNDVDSIGARMSEGPSEPWVGPLRLFVGPSHGRRRLYIVEMDMCLGALFASSRVRVLVPPMRCAGPGFWALLGTAFGLSPCAGLTCLSDGAGRELAKVRLVVEEMLERSRMGASNGSLYALRQWLASLTDIPNLEAAGKDYRYRNYAEESLDKFFQKSPKDMVTMFDNDEYEPIYANNSTEAHLMFAGKPIRLSQLNAISLALANIWKHKNVGFAGEKLLPWLRKEDDAFPKLVLEQEEDSDLPEDLLGALQATGSVVIVERGWASSAVGRPAGLFSGRLPSAFRRAPVGRAGLLNRGQRYSTALPLNTGVWGGLVGLTGRLSALVSVASQRLEAQHGAVTVCLERKLCSEEVSQLELYVSIPKLSPSWSCVREGGADEALTEALLTSFKIFRSAIDFYLMDAGIYFNAQLECPFCKFQDGVASHELTYTDSDSLHCANSGKSASPAALGLGTNHGQICAAAKKRVYLEGGLDLGCPHSLVIGDGSALRFSELGSEKALRCSFCTQSQSPAALPLLCSRCRIEYRGPSALEEESDVLRGVSGRSFRCPLCAGAFGGRGELGRHSRLRCPGADAQSPDVRGDVLMCRGPPTTLLLRGPEPGDEIHLQVLACAENVSLEYQYSEETSTLVSGLCTNRMSLSKFNIGSRYRIFVGPGTSRIDQLTACISDMSDHTADESFSLSPTYIAVILSAIGTSVAIQFSSSKEAELHYLRAGMRAETPGGESVSIQSLGRDGFIDASTLVGEARRLRWEELRPWGRRQWDACPPIMRAAYRFKPTEEERTSEAPFLLAPSPLLPFSQGQIRSPAVPSASSVVAGIWQPGLALEIHRELGDMSYTDGNAYYTGRPLQVVVSRKTSGENGTVSSSWNPVFESTGTGQFQIYYSIGFVKEASVDADMLSVMLLGKRGEKPEMVRISSSSKQLRPLGSALMQNIAAGKFDSKDALEQFAKMQHNLGIVAAPINLFKFELTTNDTKIHHHIHWGIADGKNPSLPQFIGDVLDIESLAHIRNGHRAQLSIYLPSDYRVCLAMSKPNSDNWSMRYMIQGWERGSSILSSPSLGAYPICDTEASTYVATSFLQPPTRPPPPHTTRTTGTAKARLRLRHLFARPPEPLTSPAQLAGGKGDAKLLDLDNWIIAATQTLATLLHSQLHKLAVSTPEIVFPHLEIPIEEVSESLELYAQASFAYLRLIPVGRAESMERSSDAKKSKAAATCAIHEATDAGQFRLGREHAQLKTSVFISLLTADEKQLLAHGAAQMPNLTMLIFASKNHSMDPEDESRRVEPSSFGNPADFQSLNCMTMNEDRENLHPPWLFSADLASTWWPVTLRVLELRSVYMEEIPAPILSLRALERLTINMAGLRALSPRITQLANLVCLRLNFNKLTELPMELAQLRRLAEVQATGVPFYTTTDVENMSAGLSLKEIYNRMSKYWLIPPVSETASEKPIYRAREWLRQEDVHHFLKLYCKGAMSGGEPAPREAVAAIEHLDTAPLEVSAGDDQVTRLNFNFCLDRIINDALESLGPHMKEFPPVLLRLERLESLTLDNQKMEHIDCIDDAASAGLPSMRNLRTLRLADNTYMSRLPWQLGLRPLESLSLERCASLVTPPPEIVSRGLQPILTYFRRLASGAQTVSRTKLMLVGLGGAGKTSLVEALLRSDHRLSRAGPAPAMTDGVLIRDWVTASSGRTGPMRLHFSVWDFAGQATYYHSHQFFLSARAVYLLVWNGRLGAEHAGLLFWLSSIAAHAPGAPVFVVATHADLISRNDLPRQDLKRMFPQIVHFCQIDTYNDQDVSALAEKIKKCTRAQPFMSAAIPNVWLELEQALLECRRDKNVATFKEVKTIASGSGFYDPMEIRQALLYLHELGSVQYWSSAGLRDRVVLDPQWLLAAVARLVTVKTSVVAIDWKSVDGTKLLEMKMTYTFEYLPSGVFNRIQARLCQYSETSWMWKTGAVLRKAGQAALLRQGAEREISVVVQGPAPTNFLFLIHEVTEQLLRDSFAGVAFDVAVPCADCVRAHSSEPFLFFAKQIRRAADMKVPFLQCGKMYTLVPLSELMRLLPPTDPDEVDAKLRALLKELADARAHIDADVLLLCSDKEARESWEGRLGAELGRTASLRLAETRVQSRVRLPDEEMESLMESAIGAALIVPVISGAFIQSNSCMQAFEMLHRSVPGQILPLLTIPPKNRRALSPNLRHLFDNGLLFDASKQDADTLRKFIQRLTAQLDLSSSHHSAASADVVMSYSEAERRRVLEGGGGADPLALADRLGAAGLSVWADRVNPGPFEAFTAAARGAQAALVCVSDAYLAQPRAMMEFRSLSALKAPLVLVELGSGGEERAWERSEISLIALDAPRLRLRRGRDEDFGQLLTALKDVVQMSKEADTDTCPQSRASFIELTQFTRREILAKFEQTASRLSLKGRSDFIEPYPRIIHFTFFELPNINSSEISFEISFICEYEEEMHGTSNLGPNTMGPEDLRRLAPYLYLVTSLQIKDKSVSTVFPAHLSYNYIETLKHSHPGKLCKLLQRLIEEEKEKPSLAMSLETAVSLAKTADLAGTRGGVELCRLQSRRLRWLCPRHQASAKDRLPTGDDAAVEVHDIVIEDEAKPPRIRTTATATKKPDSKICVIL